jgi:hypothetical protein
MAVAHPPEVETWEPSRSGEVTGGEENRDFVLIDPRFCASRTEA